MADEYMLIKRSTLDDIADSVRDATGLTSKFYPKDMPSYIRSIQSGSSGTAGIPDDIVAEAERVASSILSKKASNAITFIAISDMHEMGESDSADATILERYRRANRNAGQAAKLIADKIGPDFFANLGDLAWGSSSTTLHDWAQSVRAARGYTAAIEATTEAFYTPGNHDVDYADGYLDPALTTGMIGSYRYVDFASKKVRVICLNTADITDGTNSTERISGEQLQWFAESLDLSAKSDAAEWGIIILSHHPLDWGNILPAANVLAAYLAGTSYSVTHDGAAVSYDYSGKNAATVIANFHGHVHGFKVDNIHCGSAGSLQTTEVKRIAIPNACYARTNEYGENTDVDSNGIEFGEETSYEKNDNSEGKNTAFCVVTIDLDSGIIYADCFGAGYDRVISYEGAEIVTYTVTNQLTGASTSNGATVVTAGSAYAALLSADDGYEIDSVQITMGGVDVTESVYGDEYINIPSVTGDIVITAVAKATVVYDVTNLVLTSEEADSTAVYNGIGYKNGVYASENGDGTAAGSVATGYIPYTWSPENVIYLRGATITDGVGSVRFYGFTTKGTVHGSCYASGSNGLSNYFTIEQLEENYYKLTPLNTVPNVTYLRISVLGTGANLIVTVNEEIVADDGGEEGGTTGGYTNLVPTAIADDTGAIFNDPYGYMDGKYLSSSAINTFSDDAACVSTGSIMMGSDVEAIYIKGATWDESNSHARFMSGSVPGGISYQIFADGSGEYALSKFFTMEKLGDMYYKFTLTAEEAQFLRGKYYRFSLVGTGENLIITHDEPIE